MDREVGEQALGLVFPADQANRIRQLQSGLHLPFRDLTLLRKKILFVLAGSTQAVAPPDIPAPAANCAPRRVPNPELSVLLDSPEDVPRCRETQAELYFQTKLGEIEVSVTHQAEIMQ